MIRRPPSPGRRAEPTVALINVVFLMLIFFLVAGSVAPPLSRDLTLVNAKDLEGRAPPDALVLMVDGSLLYRGKPSTVSAYLDAQDDGSTARLVPDRAVAARRLVDITQGLRAAGAERVLIVTERGLP